MKEATRAEIDLAKAIEYPESMFVEHMTEEEDDEEEEEGESENVFRAVDESILLDSEPPARKATRAAVQDSSGAPNLSSEPPARYLIITARSHMVIPCI